MDLSLDKELMRNLRELNDSEQNWIRVFSAIYMNSYQALKSHKMALLDQWLTEQIKFYGRKKEEYLLMLKPMQDQYSNLIDQMIGEYNTWFCAIIMDLQETENNQKIAMANMKISIDLQESQKISASECKINNYEIVIQECKRQLEDCKLSMESKINELFFDKANQLSVRKINILHKIMNLFQGKSKVTNFVLNPWQVELQDLEKQVKIECERLNYQTIKNIAVIKDAIDQTQQVFNYMLKE